MLPFEKQKIRPRKPEPFRAAADVRIVERNPYVALDRQYAEAWKLACQALEAQWDHPKEEGSALAKFYLRLEELRVLHGDPNKPIPQGGD